MTILRESLQLNLTLLEKLVQHSPFAISASIYLERAKTLLQHGETESALRYMKIALATINRITIL